MSLELVEVVEVDLIWKRVKCRKESRSQSGGAGRRAREGCQERRCWAKICSATTLSPRVTAETLAGRCPSLRSAAPMYTLVPSPPPSSRIRATYYSSNSSPPARHQSRVAPSSCRAELTVVERRSRTAEARGTSRTSPARSPTTPRPRLVGESKGASWVDEIGIHRVVAAECRLPKKSARGEEGESKRGNALRGGRAAHPLSRR